ncbi:hypothetical protein Adu01nite_32590 [Paractinoplanes durhamensis]|uniref:MmyB-like transcription regulator ligand binding domain-containing protein n=1 Tax=Paractinoplanes durhamensis TaxID=113563 RepID=A0ABQ3YWE6_9ACTN|nr:hypothetical protein Adu01nite_32590 [Actinoplanes durhamensis]
MRLEHPVVGMLEPHYRRLIDPDLSQQLVIYAPATSSADRLRLLSVIGPATPDTTSSR